uniref:Uncharacterized protein n=1 Tax=Bactrocera latifrons TaxID=174628 RepID=A0A0K8VYE6_BACLA
MCIFISLLFQNIIKETVLKENKRKADDNDVLLQNATKRFATKSTTTTITHSWAVKLDRMDPQQRILCEKFVCETFCLKTDGNTAPKFSANLCTMQAKYLAAAVQHLLTNAIISLSDSETS